MSARDQILEYLQSHAGDCRTADIAAACECSQGAVYTALSGLTATGEITRVGPGVYRLTGGTKAPKAETKPAARETPKPNPAPLPPPEPPHEEPPVDDEPIMVPAELQMGIWSTGELTLARGETQDVIGARYGVVRSAVSAAVRKWRAMGIDEWTTRGAA